MLLLLVSCHNWQGDESDILLDVPYLRLDGGYCGQGAILMSGIYISGYKSITQGYINKVLSWKHDQLLLSDMPELARDVFGLHLQWGTYSARMIRWQLLQQKPTIIVVDGWRDYHHVLLVIGMHDKEWIVHNPTRGAYERVAIKPHYRGFLIR